MKSKSGDREATLERENAELRRQLAESLAQQDALSEVLKGIAQPGVELAVVLQAVVAAAHRLCRADHTVLFRKDGDAYRWAAGHAMAGGSEERERNAVIHPGTGTLIGRVVLEGRPVQIEDAWTDPHYEAKKDAREGGIRTMLGVPLMREGEVIGAIGLARGQVEPFTDNQIALVQNFAAQAVIAIENARLITETREALDQQTATAEVLQVINASPGDLAPVFGAMLDKALQLCEANYGYLLAYDGEGLVAVADRGNPAFSAWVRERGKIVPEPGTINARIIGGEAVVQVADVINDPFYQSDTAMRRAVVEIGGFRTVLTVALRKDDALLGVIHVYRQEARPFSERQVALLQSFAAQAVIAMENARLITETREALDQQTATAEVLGVINSSPGDLAPVFDAMLEKALRLCDAAFGNLLTYDGESTHVAAFHGALPEHADFFRSASYRAEPGTALIRLVDGEPYLHEADITDTDAYRSGVLARRRLADIAGARTALWVALRKEGVLLGLFTIYRREVRPFTDKQIALLQNFAAQAVIAMENARLITETRENLERQTATSDILRVIAASPGDAEGTLRKIAETTMRLFNAAGTSFRIADGNAYSSAVIVGRGAEDVSASLSDPDHLVRPQTLPGTVIHENRQIHLPDLDQLDPAFTDWPGPPVFRKAGMRTLVGTPLRRSDQAFGALIVYRDELRPFTPEELQLLQSFADQAVIAMENARLLTETREALEQQTATAEVLGVINSSPGDLTPVFDAILDKAHSLCDSSAGGLILIEGDRFRFINVHGDLAFCELCRRQDWLPFSTEDGPGMLRRGELLHILDATTVTWQGAVQQLVESGGVRSLLIVPLLKDGVLFGAITAFRQEVRPFSDTQVALLQNFAAQAVIAMENARLITETREALDQQTATAEVLGVINSSPGELAPVFDAMLEKAVRLCEAAYGLMFVVEGDRIHIVAQRNVPKALSDYLAASPPRIARDTMLGRALLDRQIMHTADPTTEAPYREGVPLAVKTVELGGARAFLMAPLTTDQAVLGIFAVFRTEARAFTDKQVALTQNFAVQAVIAMENARLLTETREALDQQTATAEVLQVINSSPGDLAPVFDAMLEKAMRLCDAALSVLFRYDGTSLHLIGVRGWTADEAPWFQRWEPVPGDAMWAIVNGADVIHVADIVDTDEYRSGIESRVKMVDQTGARTAAWIPLRKDDALVGVIVIFRREVRPFTDKQIALLRNFAAQAVIAMENARLLGELRQRTEEVADLNRGLEARVAEQVDELGRVGRLRRFLAPQLAELIVSQGDEKILESHRREIVVVFCDLRGYTAFTETAEPEEVLDFLREYHGALGPLVSQFEGTLDQFSGDGIMVFFNDPVPIPDPAERAVKMAMAMREEASALTTLWRRRGRELGFGAGIAQGYATLGQIGFSERSGYTAIGTVCNVAARLCAEAKDGQILIAQRVAAGLDGDIALEDIGPLALKGITQPVVALNVALDGSAANRLRLV